MVWGMVGQWCAGSHIAIPCFYHTLCPHWTPELLYSIDTKRVQGPMHYMLVGGSNVQASSSVAMGWDASLAPMEAAENPPMVRRQVSQAAEDTAHPNP